MAGFSRLSRNRDFASDGIIPLELCPERKGWCPSLDSFDRLDVLHGAIEAGIFKPAACAVLVEASPGSREMVNLGILLGSGSGPELTTKMMQLLETVLIPFGFTRPPEYMQSMQKLASRPQPPASFDEVVALFIRQCLFAQTLPLTCLSVFDGKLHIRHPSTPKYLAGELIDSGDFGFVYNCTQLMPDGQQRPCAMKIIDVQKIAGKGDSQRRSVKEFLERIDREFLIPSFIRHPGIVGFVDHLSVQPRQGKPRFTEMAGFAGAKKYIAMELAPADALKQIMSGSFSVREKRSVVAQLGRTFLYMHRLDPGIAHRDVKPENVGYGRTADGSIFVKVFDFGLARLIGSTASKQGMSPAGTAVYMAPEIFANKPHDTRVDDFSLGMTIAAIIGESFPKRKRGGRGGLTADDFKCAVLDHTSDGNEPIFCCDAYGRPQFQMIDEHGQTVPRPCNNGNWWRQKFADADAGLPPAAGSVRDIICGLCHEDPQQRMTLIDALRHPWFGEYALTEAQLAEIDVMCAETNARRLAALGDGGVMDVAADEGEALLQMYDLVPRNDA